MRYMVVILALLAASCRQSFLCPDCPPATAADYRASKDLRCSQYSRAVGAPQPPTSYTYITPNGGVGTIWPWPSGGFYQGYVDAQNRHAIQRQAYADCMGR